MYIPYIPLDFVAEVGTIPSFPVDLVASFYQDPYYLYSGYDILMDDFSRISDSQTVYRYHSGGNVYYGTLIYWDTSRDYTLVDSDATYVAGL